MEKKNKEDLKEQFALTREQIYGKGETHSLNRNIRQPKVFKEHDVINMGEMIIKAKKIYNKTSRHKVHLTHLN